MCNRHMLLANSQDPPARGTDAINSMDLTADQLWSCEAWNADQPWL